MSINNPLAKPSHMVKPNINEVEKYIPPLIEITAKSQYKGAINREKQRTESNNAIYNIVPSFFFEKSMWPSLWELSSRVVLYLPFSRVPKEQFLCQFLGSVPRKCWQYKFRSHRHIRLSPCFGIFMSLTPSMWRKKNFYRLFHASESLFSRFPQNAAIYRFWIYERFLGLTLYRT